MSAPSQPLGIFSHRGIEEGRWSGAQFPAGIATPSLEKAITAEKKEGVRSLVRLDYSGCKHKRTGRRTPVSLLAV